MVEPRRALDPCVRRDCVGWPNLLLHLARRPVRAAGEKLGAQRRVSIHMDGAQRRLLRRREANQPRCERGAGALVSLGSVHHLAAIFGTIMTANVWFCILPAQREMIAAAARGARFDSALGAQAKLRSKHNTFMAVPVVFLMLSNHYPVATYGNHYNWPVLVVLVVLGWGAAKVVREA